MLRRHTMRRGIAVGGLAVLSLVVIGAAGSLPTRPAAAAAMTWRAVVGAQTGDYAIQALAFLPNDLTVDAGDQITWTFPTDEVHTVTFSAAVDSGLLKEGQTFTVAFPTAGTFAFHCRIHPHMTGTVHVQPAGTPYPHDQGFYTREGRDQGRDLLVAGLKDRAEEQAATVAGPSRTAVTVGAAHPDDVITTPGGEQSYMIARFLPGTRSVRVGETVTWTAEDFATPHTITFGAPPASPVGPVGLTGPGEHTTLTTPYPQVGVGPTVSSGFVGAATVSGAHGTTFTVTFATPGTYRYYCALHRDLGMTGTIIVQ